MPWEHPMTAAAAIVPDEVKDYFIHKNAAGGRAYFIPRPDPTILQAVLKECDPVRDVNIQEAPLWPLTRGQAYPGALTYLHKVKGGHDVYCAPDDLGGVRDALEARFGPPEAARLDWKPRVAAPVTDDETAQTLLKFLDILDDNDDVQRVAANYDIPDEVMERLGA